MPTPLTDQADTWQEQLEAVRVAEGFDSYEMNFSEFAYAVMEKADEATQQGFQKNDAIVEYMIVAFREVKRWSEWREKQRRLKELQGR